MALTRLFACASSARATAMLVLPTAARAITVVQNFEVPIGASYLQRCLSKTGKARNATCSSRRNAFTSIYHSQLPPLTGNGRVARGPAVPVEVRDNLRV